MNRGHSPHQFALTRIIFGIYLICHFGQAFWGLLAFLSILLTLGIFRRPISVLILFGWAYFFNWNLFLANPNLAYIGWLLLAFSLVPSGEPLSFGKRNFDWRMQPLIFWGAWILMAVGYSVSGIHKLWSPSWIDGSALHHVLTNPLARDNWFVYAALYFMLGLEVLYAPLSVFSLLRPYLWILMVLMHFGIILTINFPDLTLGILMIHLFTIDPKWSLLRDKKKERIVFFDGVCSLCNGFVDFVVTENQNMWLKVAPLQGETAQQKLDKNLSQDMSTVVLFSNGQVYTKSNAVLRIAFSLGGIWNAAIVFFLVPRILRDMVYDFIANHRYAWFGKYETCRLPSAREREHFLP